MFFRKRKKDEEKEAKALEKIMLEVLKAEENKEKKENELKEKLSKEYNDFPIHKLIHILIKKNIIQLKDLESEK